MILNDNGRQDDTVLLHRGVTLHVLERGQGVIAVGVDRTGCTQTVERLDVLRPGGAFDAVDGLNHFGVSLSTGEEAGFRVVQ